MKFSRQFEILPEVYKQAFRDDVNFRYHLRRSMIITVMFFLFGFILNSIVDMGLGFINNIVLVIVIVATIVNACIEFIFPKVAYSALKKEGKTCGTITLSDDGIFIKSFDYQSNVVWSECGGITQNADAFILYITGGIFVLPKSIFTDKKEQKVIEEKLVEKGNRQRPIYFIK